MHAVNGAFEIGYDDKNITKRRTWYNLQTCHWNVAQTTLSKIIHSSMMAHFTFCRPLVKVCYFVTLNLILTLTACIKRGSNFYIKCV